MSARILSSVLAAALLGWALPSPAHGLSLPDPDTAAMEPQVAAAIGAARREVVHSPVSAEAWARLGRVLYAHGLFSGATFSFDRAAERAPLDHRWPYLAARSAEHDDLEAARSRAARAARLRPDYTPTHLLLGRIEELRGRPAAAVTHYRTALAADGRCAPAEFALGRLLLEAGDEAAGLRHLERARDLQPGSGSIHGILARAYHRIGDRLRAGRAARRARGLAAEVALQDPLRDWVVEAAVSTPGYRQRAARAERRGDLETALDLHRRVIELHPDEAGARYNVGNFLYRNGRPGEAEVHLREALRLDPGHGRSHLVLGAVLLWRGASAEGLEHLERPRTLSAGDARFLADLGAALLAGERAGTAVRVLRRAVAAGPDSAVAQQRLGQALARRGRLPEAIDRYRAALALRPDGGGVHVDLAMALALARRPGPAWEHVARARAAGVQPPADFLEWLGRQMPDPAAAGPASGAGPLSRNR